MPANSEDFGREDNAEEHSFDDLAKGLAEGNLTRSRAIKLAGAAVLSGAFSFLALPDEAEARRRKKKRRRPRPRAYGFTGSITGFDTDQVGRLVRNGVASTCASPKAFPGLQDSTSRNCDVYTLTNGRTAACVTVGFIPACSSAGIQSAAYTPTFNPANIAQNYTADAGSTPSDGQTGTYSFIVPANTTFAVVVNEVNAGAGCASYTLGVSGLSPF